MNGTLLRILDANANRAAEALRVLEDLARFVVVDPALSASAKHIRHAVRQSLRLADPLGSAIAWRDTPADPGTSNKADDEGSRSNLRDIAAAASNRAAEALRVIEETLKLTPPSSPTSNRSEPQPWRQIESLRYSLYELAKRITLALPSPPATQWKLCVLISRASCRLDWRETARRALDGGADCIQLREKDLPDADLLRSALELRTITRRTNASLIINDRIDIALLSGADGVHLGQSDLTVEHVRKLAGRTLLVGVSTHDMAEATSAVAAGADICGVGAMFPSPTKSRDTSGVAYLRQYLADERTARVPHLAIGGITPNNIDQLTEAGCRGIAVSSIVCQSESPEHECRLLRRAIDAATPSPLSREA